MTVRICASVTGRTLKDVKRMVEKAERNGADLIEVRVDYLRGGWSPKEVRALSNLPLIATNRPIREGGLFEGPEEERLRVLSSAANSGFEFIDLELSAEGSEKMVKRMIDAGVGTIVSSHIFDSTPSLSTLNLILKREMSTHANICKVVTLAKRFDDNLRCLRFVGEASKKAKVACFCMGELGITSRLLSPLVGGCFTYASVEKGRESAPGQLTLAEMRGFYEVLGA